MTPDIPAPTVSLAEIAHTALIALFNQVGHQPSAEQWEAILDLLDHLEFAANRSLDLACYISAIPAGSGKSASLAAFARALLDSPHYPGTGMLITCNRVAEVRDMAAALATHRDKLCVIVGRDHADVLAMGGHTEANGAQLVISTQAALKESLKAARTFDRAHRFHYRGARRDVVAWDEAICFDRPVVLDADTVIGLSKAMRSQSPEAATVLKEWAVTLDRTDTGQCDVPDFEALGIDFRRLEEDASDRDDLATHARALSVISGGTGWVLRENIGASSVISHVPELPASLMPLIVTDASAAVGVHHAGYVQMARTRRVVRLKEARKSYRNMTLRIVPTAASRSTYKDKASTKGKELIEMAVRYVRSVAPDDVLIVSYKAWMTMRGVEERTIRAAIDARLTDAERARVRHLTYGNHTATNQHRNVRRVLLMGLNFIPKAASYAASGAALNKPMRTTDPTDHPTEVQVEDMRVGMLRDATLQALLRGNARMGVDGDCGTMEAVIPQVRQTGLRDADYGGMFPGVLIVQDHALMPAKPLKGRLKSLSDIVARRLEAGEREMTNPSLCAELGMERKNFAKLVKAPEWQAWVAAMGFNPGPLKGRVMGLRKVA